MHVGYGSVFQNPNNQLSDREVWRNEIRLAEMAEHWGSTRCGRSNIILTITPCAPTRRNS
jgi:hypothetical protein